ncbi:MAG TPA: DUF448 domain-containing protein [Ferrovibrio sp.]|jgi:predicted RNA-binding protein YlxR (DUF448 family)|uniref:DUF448 domain-containing protein n=1 Tax=Ferrovibrio sp. TaxID=1917215 RepID=UPI002ED66DF0
MPEEFRGPLRRCLLTGRRAPPERLLRFAVDAAGAVVPDPARRMPGRGLWLAPGPAAVETARRKGLFARAARRRVRVPEDLAARARTAWTAHVAAQIEKARRAGLVLAGPAAAGDDVLEVDAAVLGGGRLTLRRTPLTRRMAADLALLAALGSGSDCQE